VHPGGVLEYPVGDLSNIPVEFARSTANLYPHPYVFGDDILGVRRVDLSDVDPRRPASVSRDPIQVLYGSRSRLEGVTASVSSSASMSTRTPTVGPLPLPNFRSATIPVTPSITSRLVSGVVFR